MMMQIRQQWNGFFGRKGGSGNSVSPAFALPALSEGLGFVVFATSARPPHLAEHSKGNTAQN